VIAQFLVELALDVGAMNDGADAELRDTEHALDRHD
jgi:hypothetical protein